MKTFLELVRSGEAIPSDVDAWVEAWHGREGPDAGDLPLHLSMGLTFEEYGKWVAAPDFIAREFEEKALGQKEAHGIGIRFGVGGHEQESSFMNATLNERSEVVESIATWAPDAYESLTDAEYAEALQRDLAPLIERGWRFSVQRGLTEKAAERRHGLMVERFAREMAA